MPIKRATSRVHKGGGGPPARRAVGGATSKDQLVQLKQQLQDLGEENRNLKLRLNELRRAGRASTRVVRETTKFDVITLPTINTEQRPTRPKSAADQALQTKIRELQARLEAAEAATDEQVALLIAERKDAADAKVRAQEQRKLLDSRAKAAAHASTSTELQQLAQARAAVEVWKARCDKAEANAADLTDQVTGYTEKDAFWKEQLKALRDDLMVKLQELYQKHTLEMKHVAERDRKLKLAWAKREEDFANLWDKRERDFKKMADTAKVTTSRVSTKLRFTVGSNGKVEELDGSAAVDQLAALGIGAGSQNASPSNPLGLPIEECSDGLTGDGWGGERNSWKSDSDGGGGGSVGGGDGSGRGARLSAADGFRGSTKAKSEALLTRHNDTVSKAKARPHWDWDSVVT